MITTLILLTSALGGPPVSEVKPPQVQVFGALKTIMHQGDTRAHVQLSDLNSQPGLFALGAMEGLAGEILILDGVPLHSRPNGDSVYIDRKFSGGATLLVASTVTQWTEIRVPPAIRDQKQLIGFIQFTAEKLGFGRDNPFPFLLRGQVENIQWHVIDGTKIQAGDSHEKHRQSGPHGILRDADVEILGFYSKNHKGVFTHHDTPVHMHFVLKDHTLAGHLDSLVPQKLVLALPKQ